MLLQFRRSFKINGYNIFFKYGVLVRGKEMCQGRIRCEQGSANIWIQEATYGLPSCNSCLHLADNNPLCWLLIKSRTKVGRASDQQLFEGLYFGCACFLEWQFCSVCPCKHIDAIIWCRLSAEWCCPIVNKKIAQYRAFLSTLWVQYECYLQGIINPGATADKMLTAFGGIEFLELTLVCTVLALCFEHQSARPIRVRGILEEMMTWSAWWVIFFRR